MYVQKVQGFALPRAGFNPRSSVSRVLKKHPLILSRFRLATPRALEVLSRAPQLLSKLETGFHRKETLTVGLARALSSNGLTVMGVQSNYELGDTSKQPCLARALSLSELRGG